MQFPVDALQRCRRCLHIVHQQSARHHQQAECRPALSGRHGRAGAGRRRPHPVGEPLQPRSGHGTAAAASVGTGCRKTDANRFGSRPCAGSGACSHAASRQDGDRHSCASQAVQDRRAGRRAQCKCRATRHRNRGAGRRDTFRPRRALPRAGRCHRQGQRDRSEEGHPQRPEDRHSRLRLFEQGGAEGRRRQAGEHAEAARAGEGRCAAAAAQGQGRQVGRSGRRVGRGRGLEKPQVRTAGGRGQAGRCRRHLHRAKGRLDVVDLPQDRRQRRGAEAGQRHEGRPAQDRPDAQGSSRRHRSGGSREARGRQAGGRSGDNGNDAASRQDHRDTRLLYAAEEGRQGHPAGRGRRCGGRCAAA